MNKDTQEVENAEEYKEPFQRVVNNIIDHPAFLPAGAGVIVLILVIVNVFF